MAEKSDPSLAELGREMNDLAGSSEPCPQPHRPPSCLYGEYVASFGEIRNDQEAEGGDDEKNVYP